MAAEEPPAARKAKREPGRGFAPLKTLKPCCGDRRFAVLTAASFALSLIVPVYSLEVPGPAGAGRVPTKTWVPAVMTVGQLSEFPALLLLGVCLKRLGVVRRRS